jgi:hypothetical protein
MNARVVAVDDILLFVLAITYPFAFQITFIRSQTLV